MDDGTLQLLLGPYGLTVGAVLVAGGLTRAALHLHRLNQDLHQKRVDDQEKYLSLVESQQNNHLETQRVVTRALVLIERVEKHLDDKGQ